MKCIVAPDSFKESMTAQQATTSIISGLQHIFSERHHQFIGIPMADGGEGTMTVLTQALQGELVTCEMTGPLDTVVQAQYGYCQEQQVAIIEVAQACGLHLVPQSQRNPLHTTTFGVGELFQEAIKQGAKHLVIGLGGSGTNDGGVGMLTALGAKFYHKDEPVEALTGKDLSLIDRVNLEEVHEVLKGIKLQIICDVDNPLVGPEGATYTFGPQKGATEEQLGTLELGMLNWGQVLEQATGKCLLMQPKAGAAGGLGGVCLALGGEMQSGIETVLKLTQFEQHIQDADFVLTGEGRVDHQTLSGKVVAGIAKCCKQHDVPVIVVAGSVGDDLDDLYEIGVTSVFGIVDGAKSLEEALKDGQSSIRKTSENIARLMR